MTALSPDPPGCLRISAAVAFHRAYLENLSHAASSAALVPNWLLLKADLSLPSISSCIDLVIACKQMIIKPWRYAVRRSIVSAGNCIVHFRAEYEYESPACSGQLQEARHELPLNQHLDFLASGA